MSHPFSPRPSQRKILEYAGGMLGISAVPGSGKTHTLSALAAQLIAAGRLGPEQEILIVTLVNSAVENFSARLAAFAKSRYLIPHLGYRVRTLHGLAHDIVRENPPMAGLDKKFTIVDEIAAAAMVRDAARAWVHLHRDVGAAYLRQDLGDGQVRQVESKHWPELIESVATSFIKAAKDRRLTPESLLRALDRQPAPLLLARMGAEIYATYQSGLVYRGAVDFDDLIRLAADMLATSPELVERLRYRWPFILEDEAQDSSELQQLILSTLAGPDGNWVRVGDPNQAIFETFTTAGPELLRSFIREHASVPMPESGRCQPSIRALANSLVKWTMNDHPIREIRNALSEPFIEPAPAGDPQPNPPDDPAGIALASDQLTPQEEVSAVARSLQEWLPTHLESTVAVLSSTNDHAANMVKALQSRGIRHLELLRSTSPTRAVAGALSHVLAYLADPAASVKLAQAYKVWRREWRGDKVRELLSGRAGGILGKFKALEDYVAPLVPSSALESIEAAMPLAGGALDGASDDAKLELRTELKAFREVVSRWHGATVLPIDQLVLTLAQDIFKSAADLALAHKLALVLGQLADENPQWRLPELTPHLNEIARNERKFIGFSGDDAGFEPDAHRGVVVVATMHKAKGLEWDRVYLLSVNDYDFPSAQPTDRFVSEKWFLRDDLNLEAEALAQLNSTLSESDFEYYREGAQTRRARLDYARERLRLLYVGITRARKELIVTWNTGRRGKAVPALALAALQGWGAGKHPVARVQAD
ncbi:MAG: ATP-dependent helicase [Chloroflexota bacterium]